MANSRDLERSESPETGKPIVAFALKSLDLTNSGIAALGPFFSVIAPFGAFPNIYAKAYTVGLGLGLPGCIAKTTLDIAAERGNATARKAQKPLNRVIDATNIANFALTAVIAAYVVVYASIHFHHSKDKEVDISNNAYGFGLVLPTALVGVSHAALEWTKHRWEHSPSTPATIARWTQHGIHSVYNASSLNALFALALSPFGISETGNVNPYGRLSIFLSALLLGIAGVIASTKKPHTAPSIERIINTSCAIAYLGEVFAKDSRETMGEGFTTSFIITFSAMALASAIASYQQVYKDPAHPERKALLQHSVFAPVQEQEPEAQPSTVLELRAST